MKSAVLPLVGLLATTVFLAYRNFPLPQPERLLYEVVDLGESCRPIAINNRGETLLRTETDHGIRHSDGSFSPIEINLGEPHVLVALNDTGSVLGRTATGQRDEKGFLWIPGKGVQFLPETVKTEDGRDVSLVNAYSLSNGGAIAVSVHGAEGYRRGVLTPDGIVRIISIRGRSLG